ncbi:PREDICTED: heavy metal-associated isoprenylated plant protein 3-like [Nicotiana attenuata]|uniref:Heavy metal-associated isoprenylated plant protein 3 n=1 Tax=Nicotiana attenuata TaxID=49451 RepID=A0A1J6IG57_NICAT|nr:PREDICTED: heavy metal-associated isoprenylated plant protein 3-like [Nicotiana attenuata]OIS97914.1 heavy metal-associated isoprenylated plant protein 3 [Nicotiana attenuata]
MTKITNSSIPLIQPLKILQFLKKEVIKAKGVEKKNDAGEKTAGGGDAAGEKTTGGFSDAGDDELATILLKLDLHCEGCAKKAKRSIRRFEAVEDVKADYTSGKLTVKGNVDPLWLQEMVENKTKKKVELLSAQPKKDGGAGGDDGDKKSDDKVEKKAEEKKGEDKKPKEPQFNTVVLKIRLQCDRNAQKAKRIIKKIDGVEEVSIALEKDMVTVKGTMNVKELTSSYLKDKLKRNIDVVITPKKDGESKVSSTELKEQKTEVINKMEYYGHSNPNTYYAMPMYNHNYMDQDYGLAMHNPRMVTGQDYIYDHIGGYVPPPFLTAPQMFSDENPNGCSLM